jgi:hypothetical protein
MLYIDEPTLKSSRGWTFVFLCIDDGDARTIVSKGPSAHAVLPHPPHFPVKMFEIGRHG